MRLKHKPTDQEKLFYRTCIIPNSEIIKRIANEPNEKLRNIMLKSLGVTSEIKSEQK